MRIPVFHFHRHHRSSLLASSGASTEVHESAVSLAPLSFPKTEHDGGGMSELIPILTAMHQQESENGAYNPSGRFAYHTEQQRNGEQLLGNLAEKKDSMVDEKCRSKMLDWCLKIIDHFDIDRNILALSAYYQDRFLGTDKGKAARNNRVIFRVVSVTSLYIAVKLRLSHQWNVTAVSFAQLCQGTISGAEIDDMEQDILFALRWNVNPPIPMEYAQAYLDLIFNPKECGMRRSLSLQSDHDIVFGVPLFSSSSDDISYTDDSIRDHTYFHELKRHILDLVQYQLEISLHDTRLFQVKSSVVATAAMLNSLEGVMNDSPFFHAGASFCQENIVLILSTMKLCEIASENELEHIRSTLLSSVVSPFESSKGVDDVESRTKCAPHILNHEDHLPATISAPVASCLASSSNMHGHSVTPQSVLSKVFALHYI